MTHRLSPAGPLAWARLARFSGLLLLGAAAGCPPEGELVTDNTSMTSECGQRARIDNQVKQQAVTDFTAAGKTCQPYDMQISSTNPQETLWRVCCGGVAFTYIYFPQKCVVRRSAGPLECK